MLIINLWPQKSPRPWTCQVFWMTSLSLTHRKPASHYLCSCLVCCNAICSNLTNFVLKLKIFYVTSKLWYFSPFFTCSVNQPIPQRPLFWLKFIHNENSVLLFCIIFASVIFLLIFKLTSAVISWKVLKNYSNKN